MSKEARNPILQKKIKEALSAKRRNKQTLAKNILNLVTLEEYHGQPKLTIAQMREQGMLPLSQALFQLRRYDDMIDMNKIKDLNNL